MLFRYDEISGLMHCNINTIQEILYLSTRIINILLNESISITFKNPLHVTPNNKYQFTWIYKSIHIAGTPWKLHIGIFTTILKCVGLMCLNNFSNTLVLHLIIYDGYFQTLKSFKITNCFEKYYVIAYSSSIQHQNTLNYLCIINIYSL